MPLVALHIEHPSKNRYLSLSYFIFFHFSSALGNPGIVELYCTCVPRKVTVVQVKTDYVQVKTTFLFLGTTYIVLFEKYDK